MMKTLARSKWVILDKIEEQATTTGGLLLTQADQMHLGVEKAIVTGIGPLVTDAIKIGDIAIYDKNHTNKVDIEGEIFQILWEDHIILVQRDEEDGSDG